MSSPGWCSSVDWVQTWKAKGHQFDSQSGHIHAWVTGQVPSRGRARGNHTLMFLSLSPSLPLSLKISKIRVMTGIWTRTARFQLHKGLVYYSFSAFTGYLYYWHSASNENCMCCVQQSNTWFHALVTSSTIYKQSISLKI